MTRKYHRLERQDPRCTEGTDRPPASHQSKPPAAWPCLMCEAVAAFKIADLGQLRLHTPGGNSEPWEAWEISAYADEAIRMGRRSKALALMLGVCLGQREGDVIRLPRSAYDPATRTITLRQRKTKKPLAFPGLAELRREIELAPVSGIQLVISEQTGRPYKEDNFRHIHRDICQAAGIADAAGSCTCATRRRRGSARQVARTISSAPSRVIGIAAWSRAMFSRPTRWRKRPSGSWWNTGQGSPNREPRRKTLTATESGLLSA